MRQEISPVSFVCLRTKTMFCGGVYSNATQIALQPMRARWGSICMRRARTQIGEGNPHHYGKRVAGLADAIRSAGAPVPRVKARGNAASQHFLSLSLQKPIPVSCTQAPLQSMSSKRERKESAGA